MLSPQKRMPRRSSCSTAVPVVVAADVVQRRGRGAARARRRRARSRGRPWSAAGRGRRRRPPAGRARPAAATARRSRARGWTRARGSRRGGASRPAPPSSYQGAHSKATCPTSLSITQPRPSRPKRRRAAELGRSRATSVGPQLRSPARRPRRWWRSASRPRGRSLRESAQTGQTGGTDESAASGRSWCRRTPGAAGAGPRSASVLVVSDQSSGSRRGAALTAAGAAAGRAAGRRARRRSPSTAAAKAAIWRRRARRRRTAPVGPRRRGRDAARASPPAVWPIVSTATHLPRGAEHLQPPARQRLRAVVGDVQVDQHAAAPCGRSARRRRPRRSPAPAVWVSARRSTSVSPSRKSDQVEPVRREVHQRAAAGARRVGAPVVGACRPASSRGGSQQQ